MKRVGVLLAVLATVGCNDAADVRQNLAQCMLDKEAKVSTGGWNDSYLQLCMQGRRFVLDINTTDMCKAVDYPQIEADCYRRDGNDFFQRLFGQSKSN